MGRTVRLGVKLRRTGADIVDTSSAPLEHSRLREGVSYCDKTTLLSMFLNGEGQRLTIANSVPRILDLSRASESANKTLFRSYLECNPPDESEISCSND